MIRIAPIALPISYSRFYILYLVGQGHPHKEGKRVLFPLAQPVGVPRLPVHGLQTRGAAGHEGVHTTRKPQRDLAPEHRHDFLFAAQNSSHQPVYLHVIKKKRIREI